MIADVIARFDDRYTIIEIDGQFIALLFEPYLPYADGGQEFLLDSYFLHYDIIYQRTKRIREALTEAGARNEGIESLRYGLKELFVWCGLARYCRNRLIRIGQYGTYCALSAIILTDVDESILTRAKRIDVDEAQKATESGAYTFAGCAGCGRCYEACPMGALTDRGIDTDECVRARQLRLDTASLTDLQRGRLLLGCNRCQTACPFNPKGRESVPEDIAPLLNYDAMHEVINGGKASISRLYRHIGKNYARPMKMNTLLDVFCHKNTK